MTSRGNFLKNVSRIRRNKRHLCKIQGKRAWPRHSTPPICMCPASNTNHSSCLGAMNVQHTFEQNLSFNKCLSCPHYFIKSWVLKMHFRNPSVKGNPLPVWGIIFSTEKSFSHHTNELVTSESPFPALAQALVNAFIVQKYLGSEIRPWSTVQLSQGSISVSEYRTRLNSIYIGPLLPYQGLIQVVVLARDHITPLRVVLQLLNMLHVSRQKTPRMTPL